MTTRAANTSLWTRSAPAFENYADESDQPEITLAWGVINQPSRIEDAETFADLLIDHHHPAARRVDVWPITQHAALDQRHNIRGHNNSGRWANLGPSPNDVKGIGFDYFEQVLLQPSVVALGNVVGNTIFNATILNTFRRDNQTINSIVNNAGAGISVGGSAPPTPLQALQDKAYVITVTTNGPPQIEGTIDWVTTAGTLQLLLTGTRIIIFPYPPQSNITEKLKWLTDVVKSADGTEQRHALRVSPRQSVAYEIVADDLVDINKIRNLFVDWTTRVFGVPVWWYERSLRADVAVDDLTIFVRPGGLDYADFRVGGLAMIYQEHEDGTFTQDSLQIAEIIKSVHSPESLQDSITFATAVQNNYDGDLATVVPVIPSVMVGGAKQTTPPAAESSRYNLKFDMLENDPDIPGIDAAWYPELDDFEGRSTLVITDKNTLDGNALNETFQQKTQRVDYDIGKFQQLTQELQARRSTPFKWVVEDAPFEWQLRALLHYLRGKLRNVWVPTNRHDFNVNANIGVGAANFDVDNWDFAAFVAGASPWSGVRIQKTDGSVSYHRITNATTIDATTERIEIDPVTPFATLVTEVEKVDLMILTRMADDSVTITHDWHDAESDVLDSLAETGFVGDVQ